MVIPLPGQKKTKLHKKYLKLVENKAKQEESQNQEKKEEKNDEKNQEKNEEKTEEKTQEPVPIEEKKLGYGLNLMKKPTAPPVISAPIPESKPQPVPGIYTIPRKF